MNIAKRLRAAIRRIVEAKTASHTIQYADMTDEQKAAFDQAFAHMDEAFNSLRSAFDGARRP